MSFFLEQFEKYGADVQGVMDRFLDDEELLMTCLDQFADGNEFEGLQEALNIKDYDKSFEIAHALKGVSGNLGLTPLFNSICVLVEALRAKEYEHIEEQLNDVLEKRKEFVKTYEEMK